MTRTTHTFRLALLGVAAATAFVLTSCSASRTIMTESAAASDAPVQADHVNADKHAGACAGHVGAVSVDGDVRVPTGATCVLDGTVVAGNVSVGAGARLYARAVDVDGDIEGERTAAVEITGGSDIGGNLQLESGGTAIVTDTHVDGDLSWEEQHGALLTRGNTVGGNLELDGNTGGVTVSDNTVGGDLSCEDNSPAPQAGGNTVSGDEDDQCHAQ